MSVWESIEALADFVPRSAHKEVLHNRRQWADRFDGVQSAMWWLRAGTLPDASDAVRRLDCLERMGPSEYAFTFQTTFRAPVYVEP